MMKRMALRDLPLICVLAAGVLSAQVTVREDKLSLSLWNEGPPDPNPQFSFFSNDIFPNYPYPIRVQVNKTGHAEQFREIVLENEYLSCRVAPDLGGHLAGCTDKITGREVFYANPAVRRAGDGQRGSFFPMGIESSFPIAHSRVSGSPVDFAWSNRDGVGRVIVEDTDRVSGMQWRVEFILRQGVAVLEQHVTLHNGSLARRGYHWWANAAIELDDPHLRFVYPVKWMLPHNDQPMTSWPLSATGVDLSDVANYKDQTGWFAHGSHEPWMAVYKPKFRAGVAHYANADDVSGKKLWLWGESDKFVKENLTENFNSYVEMQAGLFETQPEFAFLIPEASRSFTHYWIPFHDLGGISRATTDAVVNLARTGKAVRVELEATHAVKGARIRFSAGDGKPAVFEANADLDPRAVWSKSLDPAPSRLTVDVSTAAGEVILHHVEGEYDGLAFDRNARNPEPQPPSGKLTSESAYLERGLFDEQRDETAAAWGEYLAGLEKFPNSEPLIKAAGRTAFLLSRYDDVVKLLAPLVSRPLAYHPEDQYYYGVASAKTGAIQQAKAALAKAAGDPAWGTAARVQLALLAAREHDLNAALETIQPLAASSGATVWTGAFEVALLRRAGKTEAARQRLQFWSDRDPANNMIRVERVLLGDGDDPALWEHLAGDPERVLNLVDRYLEMGAAEDALKLLDRRYPAVPAIEMEPGTALPQDNPLIAYYRGYCRSLLGQKGDSDFTAAGSLSTQYVFPHRASSYAVLKAAIAANNSDAAAHDLLGDLYFNSLDADHAIAEWRQALALKSDLPALARNLGRALLDVKGDNGAARAVLLQGARMNPGDTEITQALDRAGANSAPARRFTIPQVNVASLRNATPAVSPAEPRAPKALPVPPAASGDIASTALIRSILQPDQAASMFTPGNFPKEKQPDAVRRAYIEVQLQRLLSMAGSHRCGDALAGLVTLGDEDGNLAFTLYGFGSYMKAPHFQYFEGVIAALCGDERAARKFWSKLPKPGPVMSAEDAFSWLALLRTNSEEAKPKMAAAIETLTKRLSAGESSGDLVFAAGVLLVAAGQREQGSALLERAARAPEPMVQYLSLAALRGVSRN